MNEERRMEGKKNSIHAFQQTQFKKIKFQI